MELNILDCIQQIRTETLDMFFRTVSFLGDGGVCWILFTLTLLVFRKTRKAGIIMACALIFNAVICNLILKPAVARTRPYDINTAVNLIVKRPNDFSFPSGHTSASFTCTTSLFMLKIKKFWIPSLVLACLIAFSRMYLYVHYPTDILGGIAVGVLSGLASWFVFRRVWNNNDLVKNS